MKKQTAKKIISCLIIFIFIVSAFQKIPTVNAANNLSNYYSNPNQSNNGAYKFKISDVVNSSTLTSVVGCTGIVNKVAGLMAGILQSPFKTLAAKKKEIAKTAEQIRRTCAAVKAGVQGGLGTVPVASDTVTGPTTGLEAVPFCEKVTQAKNDEEVVALEEEAKKTQARDFKEQCFDGIAITLAKNQLTAMTRSAMNWVNSGYGGNPFFVQNMQRLTTSLEQNVIETGIDVLLDPGQQNPYARSFATTTINSRNILSSSSGFLGSLTSDLENFVTDPKSYYTNEQLNGAYNTETALQRARSTNDAFARDFSLGGWNGWLALTQREKNNPLGFNMVTSQYLADLQNQKVSQAKDEITQNNGFMGQKECIKWQEYVKDENGEIVSKRKNVAGTGGNTGLAQMTELVFSNSKPSNGLGQCVDWKITTPGSLIKDKVTNYINSPERQLELAKTINDSLNALFSILISKLEGGGLSGLSDSAVTTNWTDNINSLSLGGNGSNTYDNGGSYNGFNLTRDLGNTYIHDNVGEPVGTWDAQLNLTNINGWEKIDGVNTKTTTKIKLYPDIAPIVYDKDGNQIVPQYVYYTVSNPGKSVLVSSGYNDWQVGDRAFWDGEKWQNWKKGQQSPIKKRGVIQIQQDYVVAGKEMLKVLPGVMPALGELDYCLPGPNPSYKVNSSLAQSAYSDWINSSYVGPTDSSGERFGVKMDREGDPSYESFHKTYQNGNIWNSVMSEKIGIMKFNNETASVSNKDILSIFSNICNGKTSESFSSDVNGYSSASSILSHSDGYNCSGNYTYAKNGNLNNTQAGNLDFKNRFKEYLSDYLNNFLPNKFYEVFDQKMNSLYFKKMTNRYIEKENEPVRTLNPAYIPMAESGFEFTKNIVNYSEDVIKAQNDYADAISQTKTNLAKLEPIRERVSEIIKAAQDRRNKNLLNIINEKVDKMVAECKATQTQCDNDTENLKQCQAEYNECVSAAVKYTGGSKNIADIKKDYAKCFEEEDIKVFDVEDIVGSNEQRGKEACSDGVDNDLDGLIDSKDPDCGAVPISAPSGRTGRNSDESTTQTDTPVINYTCQAGDEELVGAAINGMRQGCDATNESTCLSRYEEGYSNNGVLTNYRCRWVSY